MRRHCPGPRWPCPCRRPGAPCRRAPASLRPAPGPAGASRPAHRRDFAARPARRALRAPDRCRGQRAARHRSTARAASCPGCGQAPPGARPGLPRPRASGPWQCAPPVCRSAHAWRPPTLSSTGWRRPASRRCRAPAAAPRGSANHPPGSAIPPRPRRCSHPPAPPRGASAAQSIRLAPGFPSCRPSPPAR